MKRVYHTEIIVLYIYSHPKILYHAHNIHKKQLIHKQNTTPNNKPNNKRNNTANKPATDTANNTRNNIPPRRTATETCYLTIRHTEYSIHITRTHIIYICIYTYCATKQFFF